MKKVIASIVIVMISQLLFISAKYEQRDNEIKKGEILLTSEEKAQRIEGVLLLGRYPTYDTIRTLVKFLIKEENDEIIEKMILAIVKSEVFCADITFVRYTIKKFRESNNFPNNIGKLIRLLNHNKMKKVKKIVKQYTLLIKKKSKIEKRISLLRENKEKLENEIIELF